MISFRYHLVSIVAVFAALAVGIVAGSTVVKQSLVDSTKKNLDRTERQLAEMSDANDALSSEVDQYKAFGAAAGDRLITGKLAGLPIVVVETPELAAEVRNGVMTAIDDAGAQVVARIRLDRSLADDDAATRLAEALTSVGGPDQLREAFGRALAAGVRDLADGIDATLIAQEAAAAAATSTTAEPTTTAAPTPETTAPFGTTDETTVVASTTTSVPETTTTTITPEVEPGPALRSESLTALDRANLVRIEDVADPFVPAAPLAVLVLADRRTDVDTTDVLTAAFVALGGAVPVVVAEDVEVGDDQTISASLTAAVRDDGDLRQALSTVDDTDRLPGWIATVLTMEARVRGRVGHYGRHDGSRGLFPPSP